MSYQVLARKWRPQNFKEMVGQQHVLRGLINALDNDRLHHAYLFTGTRGVGKTTVARILAKCLNCETGITSEPCGTCGACQEIATGRFVDLIEVDAASRTKVEDTRELLDNVQYAPTHGRFKVYLIDEVHMLSGHSFNALLKTLEEPPEHVKFLFATTDPQKLPVTILSRCLQFNLKRMTLDMISGHLKHLGQEENIPSDDESIRLLSRAADGSMRDALSLMDQAIAFGNGSLALADVQEMLGSIANDPLIALIKMISAGDGAGVISKVNDMAGVTPDFAAATDALIAMLHQLAVLQVVKGADEDDDNLRELSTNLSKEDVQLYYQIAINGRRDLSLAPDPRCGFEMLLLRMLAFRPTTVAPVALISSAPQQVAEASPVEVTPNPILKDKVVTEVEASKASVSEKVLEETAEIKKKTIASNSESGTAPAPVLKPSGQDALVEDDVPPSWDEYDQMVNEAKPLPAVDAKPMPTELPDVTPESIPDVSHQAAESHSVATAEPKTNESIAPPWNTSTNTADTTDQKENSNESASITDLLFSDFPDEAESEEPAHVEEVVIEESPPVEKAESLPTEMASDTEQLIKSVIPEVNTDKWYEITKDLKVSGLAGELAKQCVLASEDSERIELHLDSSSEMLMTNAAINEIEAALSTHFGDQRKLVVAIRELGSETPAQYNQRRIEEIQLAAEQHIINDEFVKQLSERFAARVVPGSVKPKT